MKVLHWHKNVVYEHKHFITSDTINSLITDKEVFVIKPDGNVYIFPRKTKLPVHYECEPYEE